MRSERVSKLNKRAINFLCARVVQRRREFISRCSQALRSQREIPRFPSGNKAVKSDPFYRDCFSRAQTNLNPFARPVRLFRRARVDLPVSVNTSPPHGRQAEPPCTNRAACGHVETRTVLNALIKMEMQLRTAAENSTGACSRSRVRGHDCTRTRRFRR